MTASLSSLEYSAKDSSPYLLRVGILFLVLQSVFFVLFIVSRVVSKTATGIDFWLLIPIAYTFAVLNCAFNLSINAIDAIGRHQVVVMREAPDQFTHFLKLLKVQEFVYAAAVAFPKLALLVFYKRVFPIKYYGLAIYITMGVVIAAWAAAWTSALAICRPFAFNWDKQIPGGRCGSARVFYQAFCIPNIVTDFIVALLPLPVLLKLRITTAAKIGLAVTFATGSFGIVTSMVRTVIFFSDNQGANSDRTYAFKRLSIWSVVETGCYFIAACMPFLRALHRKLIGGDIITAAIVTNIRITPRGYSQSDDYDSGRSDTTVEEDTGITCTLPNYRINERV